MTLRQRNEPTPDPTDYSYVEPLTAADKQRLRELRGEMVTPPALSLGVAEDVARLIDECPRWRFLRRRGLRQWHTNLLAKAARDA